MTHAKSADLSDKTAEKKTILEDKAIQDNLKILLGDRYEAFINNFEVLGESREARDGSLFIDGWMPQLALINASALIVEPDGNLFAAWVTPESDAIEYQSTSTKGTMPDAMLAWSERFQPRHFAEPGNVLKNDPYTEQFETEKFKITLAVECGHQQGCNDAVYHGVRKKDNAELTLHGKVIHGDCKKMYALR